MEREQSEQLLAAYLTDTLDEQTRAELEAELEKDAALRDRLADMRMVIKLLHTGLAQEPEPKLSEERRQALLTAASQSEEPAAIPFRQSWYVRWPVTVSAIAASILLLIAVMLPSLNRARSVTKFSVIQQHLGVSEQSMPSEMHDAEPLAREDSKAWEYQHRAISGQGGQIIDRGSGIKQEIGSGEGTDSPGIPHPNAAGDLAPFGIAGGGGGLGPSFSEHEKMKGIEQSASAGKSSGDGTVDLNDRLQLPKPRFEGTPKSLPPIIDGDRGFFSGAVTNRVRAGAGASLDRNASADKDGSGSLTLSGAGSLSGTNTLNSNGTVTSLRDGSGIATENYALKLERAQAGNWDTSPDLRYATGADRSGQDDKKVDPAGISSPAAPSVAPPSSTLATTTPPAARPGPSHKRSKGHAKGGSGGGGNVQYQLQQMQELADKKNDSSDALDRSRDSRAMQQQLKAQEVRKDGWVEGDAYKQQLGRDNVQIVGNVPVSGRDNIYTGDTTVSSGELDINGGKLSGTGSIESRTTTTDALVRHGERDQELQAKKGTISDLTTASRKLIAEGKYAQAKEVTEQIGKIDPDNPYARGVKPWLEDKANFAKQRESNKAYDVNVTKQLNEADEMLVPYDDVLTYPKNWPDLTEQRKISPTTRPADADDKAVLAQLERRIPEIRFENVAFSDVVDYLRDITGTNIFVNWKALEAAGIDRNAPVSARLRDIKFSKVMEVLLTDLGGKGAKVGYTVDEGVITVSTAEDLKGRATQNPGTQSAEPVEQESPQALPRASSFREVPVNPWVMTTSDRFSTFALDVDSASYSLCRSYLRSGYLPPRGAVRMEEFVNNFDYNYPRQAKGVFNIFAEGAPAPFAENGSGTTLVKIGVQGRVIGREGRKSAHLVFVVDTSGSMAKADRLPLIQNAIKMLVGALGPNDRVSLITYNRQAGLLLECVPASHRNEIRMACSGMRAGGPTNLLAGLEAGYGLAQREFKAGQINRVILCTDGAANIGQTDAKAILDRVSAYRQNGITMTVAGFGQGGYNDELLETLAKEGDGSYLFIDTLEQARNVFVEKMNATLQTIALDAKIQVEFNPDRVRRYRLIGYEKRTIADQDFRNDTVKAAEVGSGQSSTALYEVELAGNDRSDDSGPLGTVYVRYRNADTQQIEEISHRLEGQIIRRESVEDNPRYYLAACAARFAEILRDSPHAKNGNLQQVARVLERVGAALPLDNQVRELLWMVKRAQGLPKAP